MSVNLISGRVDISAQHPSYYKHLSLHLHKIMKSIGASVEMRHVWIDYSTTAEILESVAYYPTDSYRFGSTAEGTTLLSMGPDVDNVNIHNNYSVVTRTLDAPRGRALLLVQDTDTAAGYAKLQLLQDGDPLFGTDALLSYIFSQSPLFGLNIDKMSRVVFTFNPPSIVVRNRERHGPALSTTRTDHVIAVNCCRWPDCATEWLIRRRRYNWPSSDTIDRCKMMGCLLVPVGHPSSGEKDLQWRISFSKQERLLVRQFNSTQLQVYILLKLVKKEILHHFIRSESLSSYHCKTCMFYLIENTPCAFWKPENLLACLVACTELLRVWARDGICPNYFIPDENMFERRILGNIRQALNLSLQNICSSNCAFLLELHTDSLGRRLASSLLRPTHEIHNENNYITVREATINLRIRPLAHMPCKRNIFLIRYDVTNVETCATTLYRTIQDLKNTSTLTDHTVAETQKALGLLLPHLEITLMSTLIAAAKQQHQSNDTIWQLLTSDIWHELSLKSDSFTSKLKQASLMYMCGYYQSSVDLLLPLGNCLRPSLCSCGSAEEILIPHPASVLEEAEEKTNITTEYILTKLVSLCVVFLPAEQDVTPPAICYEMIRSAGMPPGSRDDNIYYWYDWAIVDAQFLLYFLLYLNHAKLNMNSHVAVDIDNMEWVINTMDISHKETCLNLLGWVYKEQGRTDRAIQCFQTSLELRPEHNAARWHMRDIDS